jgi:hypothetical protein
MLRRVLLAVPVLVLPALALGAAASAAPGGPIGTLPRGTYVCELPGDALGPAGEAQPQFNFTIIHGSSYRSGDQTGVYLLTGDRLAFTSGPFDGLRYRRLGDGFLRRTEADGTDGPLRCIRQGANNR